MREYSSSQGRLDSQASSKGWSRKFRRPKVEEPRALDWATGDWPVSPKGRNKGRPRTLEADRIVPGISSGLTTGEAAGVSCKVEETPGKASVSAIMVSEACPVSWRELVPYNTLAKRTRNEEAGTKTLKFGKLTLWATDSRRFFAFFSRNFTRASISLLERISQYVQRIPERYRNTHCFL